MLQALLNQYLNDAIGQKHWAKLQVSDERAALRHIFLHGACFDFAWALSEQTGWPVYEVMWGTALVDDPDECDIGSPDYGVHRIVQHPSGRYLDASGWTDMQSVLTRFDALNLTYQWMGEVDAEGCSTFDVDPELVLHAVRALLPDDIHLEKDSTMKLTHAKFMAVLAEANCSMTVADGVVTLSNGDTFEVPPAQAEKSMTDLFVEIIQNNCLTGLSVTEKAKIAVDRSQEEVDEMESNYYRGFARVQLISGERFIVTQPYKMMEGVIAVTTPTMSYAHMVIPVAMIQYIAND